MCKVYLVELFLLKRKRERERYYEWFFLAELVWEEVKTGKSDLHRWRMSRRSIESQQELNGQIINSLSFFSISSLVSFSLSLILCSIGYGTVGRPETSKGNGSYPIHLCFKHSQHWQKKEKGYHTFCRSSKNTIITVCLFILSLNTFSLH